MNKYDDSGNISEFPENTPLAMCYVPYQEYGKTYAENVALEKGTIFPDLYFPFLGRKVTDNAK